MTEDEAAVIRLLAVFVVILVLGAVALVVRHDDWTNAAVLMAVSVYVIVVTRRALRRMRERD